MKGNEIKEEKNCDNAFFLVSNVIYQIFLNFIRGKVRKEK